MRKQKGLYQSKVTSSLAAMQRLGHRADDCKTVYLKKTFELWGAANSVKTRYYQYFFYRNVIKLLRYKDDEEEWQRKPFLCQNPNDF